MHSTPVPLRLVVSLALATNTGCYAYLDPGAKAPLPGSDVRLVLADDRGGTLQGLLGEPVAAVTGRLLADSPDSLTVLVNSVTYRSGSVNEWRGERVAIPRALVTSVSGRQFSAGRTGLLVGALALAGLAARTLFSGASDGTNTVITLTHPGGQ